MEEQYNGPEWTSREEAIGEIRRAVKGWEEKWTAKSWEEKYRCEIVRDCASSNTYRAFAKIGKPSHIFRTWGWTILNSGQLDPIQSERQYDQLHARLVEDLRNCWQCVAEKPLSYGPATKLINLLVLHACQCDKSLRKARKQLLNFIHVPLDEYVLRAVRKPMSLDPKFPSSFKSAVMKRHPSMGSITSYDEYQFVQDWVRQLTVEADAPPIILNYLAWELPHELAALHRTD